MTSVRAVMLWLASVFGVLVLITACGSGSAPDSQPTQAPATPVESASETPQVEPERTPPPATEPPAATPTPEPTPDFGLILPDLTTNDSVELYISSTSAGGRMLHFSTEVHNVGEGPMEIVGNRDPATGETRAYQIIQTTSVGRIEVPVGRLQVSVEHGHWHLDNFATYELWSLTDEGELATILATSGKVTFCLIDEFPLDIEEWGDGVVYGPCDPHHQGISPGWGEIYEAWLPGQSLDITDVPDGRYALRTTLDPDHMLLESDRTNNVHIMYIAIEGNNVTLAPNPS